MPTVIAPIITNAGLAAAQSAAGNGLQLAITHVQLGSGGFTLNTAEGSADYNRTGLVTVKETIAIAGGHVTGKGFRVDALFAPWLTAVYNANEIGFWAGNPASGGILFAYWAQPAAFVQRNTLDYLASFAVGLARVPNGSVTVTFDATLSQSIQLMTFHEQAADPHPQYKRYFSVQTVTANTAMAASLAGGALISAGVGALSHTLPPITSLLAGDIVEVHNRSAVACSVVPAAGHSMQTVSGTYASLTIGPGEHACFIVPSAVATTWLVTGNATLRLLAAFDGSMSSAGWKKIPGQPKDTIFQWGNGGYSASTPVTYPIVFPTACLNVTMGAGNFNSGAASGSKVIPMTAANITASGFEASSATGTSVQGSWVAVGH